MALFTSTYVNRIDKKGRVSVPAPFRAELEQNDGAHFFLTPHPTLRAIDGNTPAWMAELLARVDALDMYSDERAAFEELFADTRRMQLDPEGRIMLPPDLMDHAGITDTVLFAGKGRFFQIWSETAYQQNRAQIRERVARTGLALRPAAVTLGAKA